MAQSRKFIWVEVNRDRTPDIPKRFNVSAYPTILTIEPGGKKIQRWSGANKTPADVLALFADALARWKLFRSGEPWDTKPPRAEEICDRGTVRTIPAPTGDVPCGVTVLGGDLLVCQGGKIRRSDANTGEVKAEFDAPPGVLDLTTDGKLVYAMEGGWTAGKPIHVLDPESGKVVREIVTKANEKNRAHGAKGIAWRDGKLFVLRGMRGTIDEVDPETGEVARTLKVGANWLSGLAWDGKRFVLGGRDQLLFFDPAAGTLEKVPVNYPLRTVAAAGKNLFLMEQPIFGYDTEHRRVQVWPEKTLVYNLELKSE